MFETRPIWICSLTIIFKSVRRDRRVNMQETGYLAKSGGRTHGKTDFYENLAGHFYYLAYLPMAFLPSDIFTTGIFTIWYIYQWHFFNLAYLPMTFLLSGIFINDIFTIGHIYQWHFYHMALLPMAFLPMAILPMAFLPMAFLPHTTMGPISHTGRRSTCLVAFLPEAIQYRLI